jgi:hypothetical protein
MFLAKEIGMKEAAPYGAVERTKPGHCRKSK